MSRNVDWSPIKRGTGPIIQKDIFDLAHVLEESAENPNAGFSRIQKYIIDLETENKTLKAKVANLRKTLPRTHDGVPILWGDTVYYVNEDVTPYSNDRVLSGVVDCISADMSFTCYKGTHTIQTSDYEAGNLEFYSQRNLVPQD